RPISAAHGCDIELIPRRSSDRTGELQSATSKHPARRTSSRAAGRARTHARDCRAIAGIAARRGFRVDSVFGQFPEHEQIPAFLYLNALYGKESIEWSDD